MKIALYIEDGIEQIVLTPTSDTEKAILAKVNAEDRDLQFKRGSFYECQGGWVRHGSIVREPDASLMIVMRKKGDGHG